MTHTLVRKKRKSRKLACYFCHAYSISQFVADLGKGCTPGAAALIPNHNTSTTHIHTRIRREGDDGERQIDTAQPERRKKREGKKITDLDTSDPRQEV